MKMIEAGRDERHFLAEGVSFLSRNWGWFLFRGILALILAIMAFTFPSAATFVFTALFAAYAFIDGIFSLISGIRGASRSAERWVSLVLSGIIGIGIGIVFVAWPGLSTTAYALVKVFLVAAWAIITGVLQVGAAIRLRKAIRGEWLLGLTGALSLILGVVVFGYAMANPAVAVVAVGWMIGFYALIAGVVFILLALKLRNFNKAEQAG